MYDFNNDETKTAVLKISGAKKGDGEYTCGFYAENMAQLFSSQPGGEHTSYYLEGGMEFHLIKPVKEGGKLPTDIEASDHKKGVDFKIEIASTDPTTGKVTKVLQSIENKNVLISRSGSNYSVQPVNQDVIEWVVSEGTDRFTFKSRDGGMVYYKG